MDSYYSSFHLKKLQKASFKLINGQIHSLIFKSLITELPLFRIIFSAILGLIFSIEITAQPLSFSSYEELRPEFEDVKILMLGEVDHNDQNSLIEKVELIKYLYDSLGFDVLAFESSIFDMRKANQSLKNEEPIKNSLYKGIFSIWHDEPAIDSLAKALSTRDFTLAGFDNQICSGGENICLSFTKDLRWFLDSNNISYDKKFLESLGKEFKAFAQNNYSISKEFKPSLLEGILNLSDKISAINNKESLFWYQNLISVHGLFYDHYVNKIYERDRKTFKPVDSNLRDSLMALNIRYLLNEFPESKIICWGATYHFANDVSKLKLSANDFTKAKPVGYHLKNAIDGQIKTIGFTDLAFTNTDDELLESNYLLAHEKSYIKFSENSIGKSSFLKYAPYPEGSWSNVIDLGIIINSKAPLKLSGKVVSYENDEVIPVPYALLQIEGTSKGNVSNENGQFTLIVDSDDLDKKIAFSSLGFKKESIPVSDIQEQVVLFESSQLLDEVIITPDGNGPIKILKELVQKRVENAPESPMSFFFYCLEEESNNQKSNRTVRESALEYYFENRLKKNEVKIFNILNVKNSPSYNLVRPWPFALNYGDFSSEFGFTINSTFKNLKIDTLYLFESNQKLSVLEYTHLKPNFKASGFGLTSEWKGKIIYDPEKMDIISHYKKLHFAKNEDKGLYHITFNVEYFKHLNYTFPRYMTASYSFKNEDGSVTNGTEKVVITEINLENPVKPTDQIFDFKRAPSNTDFWKSFNTIPLK